MVTNDNKLTRIGVFYDGNYFLHVSNYYNFSHPRKARISISGLHEFVRSEVAALEGVDENTCRIVDAHYFRGRLPAHEANNRNKLLSERLFDDILMKESVITHYLPLTGRGEKGVDVWLAMEMYELCLLKKYSTVVLLACDGDFVPLVRKIQSMGIRVMVLGWDFEYTDEFGNRRVTVTSAALMQEAAYPVAMQDKIDSKTSRNSSMIDSLFVPKEQNYNVGNIQRSNVDEDYDGERHTGYIQNVKEGYGFIETDSPGRNLFFYWEDVDGDFNELRIGDLVEYAIGRNHRGECAVNVVKLEDGDYDDYDGGDDYEGDETYADEYAEDYS